MKIEDKKAITINYILKDDKEAILDQSNDASFVYLHGANNIIPGLEDALTGRTKEDKFSLVINPENAYGE